jgi:hypothetical protein
MQHETIRGRILYTSKKKEILDQVRGGETFIITKHVDGRRTLRAHCAIDENSPRVLRDSITNLDKHWQPREAFVQITVDEAFVGSAWYRFTETTAECEGFTQREGRFSQRYEHSGRIAFFGTHPIQADAMHLNCYDLSKGPGTQQTPPSYMCSVHHRGADGPTLIRRPNGSTQAFIGQERITVKAGTFDALHFRFGASTDDAYMGTDIHPPYHVWTTADGDYILLKAYCTGYMQTYYELMELERRQNFF